MGMHSDLTATGMICGGDPADEFSKDMLPPDSIAGLKAVMKDAVTFRHLEKGLSRKRGVMAPFP
jgi:hypothetical protein